VNSVKFTACEKRCYDLLVKIEKEISWDTLFKIKQATFIGEGENLQWENPFFKANQSRCLITSAPARRHKKDDSLMEIRE
jgi:hypothetical protein